MSWRLLKQASKCKCNSLIQNQYLRLKIYKLSMKHVIVALKMENVLLRSSFTNPRADPRARQATGSAAFFGSQDVTGSLPKSNQ